MKVLSRDNRAIFAGFGLLIAGLALLVGLFVVSQARTAAILFEYEADRIAAGLLDGFRETGSTADGKLDSRVQAFGVYRPSGEAVAVSGTAPVTLAPGEASRAFRYETVARTLTLIRPIGPAAEAMQGMMSGRPMDMTPGMAAGRGGTLYLRLDASAFFRARRLYAAGVVLAPGAVGGIGVAFFFLLVSNIRYRRKAVEQETLARLGESARTLAHEIRNPLGAIRMQTALLRRSALGAHELDVIDEEVERLNTLSRRVGDFLRSPAGAPERIALGEYVRELARRSPYPLHVAPHMPDVSVFFDRALLRSVIENLSRNAYESYEDLPGDRAVEVGLFREDGRAVLTVRDRGKGVPGALAEKVFDPFFTDKIHGSGIGLPLSRRFVEAAGGTLTLRPREGGGTEARVVLPEMEEQ